MKKTLLIFTLFLLILNCNTAIGQLQQWQTYTCASYLSDFEETNQYYYLSTSGGLVRIKKTDFSVEVLTKSNTPIFSSNFAGNLCKDTHDNLWASAPASTAPSTGGFLKFDGQIWNSIVPNFPSSYFGGVYGLTNDANNNKWFGMGNAIAKYDGTNLYYRQVISDLMPFPL